MSQATWKSVGTPVSGTTGSVVAVIPTHAAGDWMWLIAEGSNTNWGTDPAGWDVVADLNHVGAGTFRLKVWRRKATSDSEIDPTIDPTTPNHTWAVVVLTDNVHGTHPIHAIAETRAYTTTTVPEFGQFKAHVDGCLALQITAWSNDDAGPFCSGESNATFTVTERFDAGTIDGNGGGLAIYSGELASAGDFAATRFNTTSAAWAMVTLVLAPIADQTVSGTVLIDGAAAPNASGVISVYDVTQPAASYLVATADIAGGSGAFSVPVPYDDHDYRVMYDDGAGVVGASNADTTVGGDHDIEIGGGEGGGGSCLHAIGPRIGGGLGG